jgi:tetratricopeptide (TPR) repeat protein
MSNVNQQLADILSRAADSHVDLESALILWSVVRARYPEERDAYLEPVFALRRHGRFTDAAKLLEEAAEVFPEDQWPLSEAGWMAFSEVRDYERVLELGQMVKHRFPDSHEGYHFTLCALRMLGRLHEAESFLDECAERFSGACWLMAEAAWLALCRGDWPVAISRAEAVRINHPDELAGYMVGVHSSLQAHRLEEAERLLESAKERFPNEAWLHAEAGRLAEKYQQWDTALREWEAYRSQLPDEQEGYLRGAQVAQRAGKDQEADGLLALARKRWPHDRVVALEWASLPGLELNWQEKRRRLNQLMQEIPDWPEIRLERALASVSAVEPARRDYPQALAELQELRERFPAFTAGWAAAIDLNRLSSRLTEAEHVALAALDRFPSEPSIAAAHAEVLKELGRPEEALLRLTRIPLDRMDERATVTHIRLLCALGRFEDADATCCAAMSASPSPALASEYARIARRRDDSAAVIERWDRAVRLYPDRADLVAEAENDRSIHQDRDVPHATPMTPVKDLAQEPNWILQFESLGGTAQGCEFGIVQRLLGVEPLGLLRWCAIDAEQLAQLLESGLDGVGSPEQTSLGTYQPDAGREEYKTIDQRFGMTMHTFVYKEDVPPDRMLQQCMRRLRFLRAKLLEDLAAAEKIFVFKQGHRRCTLQESLRIYEAVRGYGPAWVLNVTLADAAHASGTLERTQGDLYTGYLDHFSQLPTGELAKPNMAHWLQICERMLTLRGRQRRLQEAHATVLS